ncbi:MAG: hypothetical protein HZA60_10455 [Deltaproteobacteria bacterium]|nr:hypothetical protein [Deltaproteobacteria bacterium]
MGRLAAKIRIAAAVALLLLAASPSPGEEGKARKPPKGPPAADRKGAYRLDEVKILGSVEHPDVLFFLPRAKFRLLPVRMGQDWKEHVLRDDRATGDIPE